MRAGVILATAGVMLAVLSSVPTVSAETCYGTNVKCCYVNEGVKFLSQCTTCLALGGYWNTDVDRCYFPR